MLMSAADASSLSARMVWCVLRAHKRVCYHLALNHNASPFPTTRQPPCNQPSLSLSILAHGECPQLFTGGHLCNTTISLSRESARSEEYPRGAVLQVSLLHLRDSMLPCRKMPRSTPLVF